MTVIAGVIVAPFNASDGCWVKLSEQVTPNVVVVFVTSFGAKVSPVNELPARTSAVHLTVSPSQSVAAGVVTVNVRTYVLPGLTDGMFDTKTDCPPA